MKLGKMGKIGYLKDYEKITHFSSKHDINVMLNHIWLLYNIGVESMFKKKLTANNILTRLRRPCKKGEHIWKTLL
jgi:hypothetical protein